MDALDYMVTSNHAELKREMFWSRAAAVGDQEWLKNIK